MTPQKCAKHELRPGEAIDGARYTLAREEAKSCWRCHALAVAACVRWRWNQLWKGGRVG
jgi:hypothetical protein